MNCTNCDQFEAMLIEHLRLLGDPVPVGATPEEMARALGRTREWVERAKRVFIGVDAARHPCRAPKPAPRAELMRPELMRVGPEDLSGVVAVADMAHTPDPFEALRVWPQLLREDDR